VSTAAIRWALYSSACDDYRDLVVLVALADHASADGAADITVPSLARKLGMPARDVAASMRALSTARLVRLSARGNPVGLAMPGGAARRPGVA
jgi:hypothetical protein